MKRLVIGRGSVFADLLIIGEAPGAQEDLEGKPYVGKSGKLLNELLIKAGIDYKEDVYFESIFCRRICKNWLSTRQPNHLGVT